MNHRTTVAAAVLGAMLAGGLLPGCDPATADNQTNHQIDWHPLLPQGERSETQISAGVVTGEGPDQPIAFPHNRHVPRDGIQCEYCHSAARNSIHAGTPEISTCMGCHKSVLTDSPEIQLLTEYWNKKEPVPWKKVHDLPDFVNFSHKRHVRAGVNCTECHGQVATQGPKSFKDAEGNLVFRKPPASQHGEAVHHDEAELAKLTPAERAAATLGTPENEMVREATLQMGWCLDCHASHPSVVENYCPKDASGQDVENCPEANLRRAELKDCWTCHK